jgi:threonyl-tRNA synthetase
MENATGHIGGPFQMTEKPQFLTERENIFQRFWAENEALVANLPDQEITITLPDGTVKTGVAFKTTPYDIALSISKGLADNVIIAKVIYSRRLEADSIVACDQDEDHQIATPQAADGELWDLTRPLVGDCLLRLLKFDEPEGKTVFWHSSAHVLGAALEVSMGVHLTIGPALQVNFLTPSPSSSPFWWSSLI